MVPITRISADRWDGAKSHKWRERLLSLLNLDGGRLFLPPPPFRPPESDKALASGKEALASGKEALESVKDPWYR